ncbi:MAG: enoyl-CoA hydratase/isomerase family protein [Terriglobia bacterium]
MAEAPNDSPSLTVHHEGEVVRIELAAGGKPPRLSEAKLGELAGALGGLFQDATCGGVVIHGSAKAFATGAEIAEVRALTPATALPFALRAQKLFEKIAAAPKPVLAAISGYCLGGGLDLALACWRRVATPEAVFGHPGARLGLVSGWGGSGRLVQLVGRSHALELLLTGKRISGTEAHQIGLVDTLVPAEQLLAAAISEARALATRGLTPSEH